MAATTESTTDIVPRTPVVIYDTGIILQATLNPDVPGERALQLAVNGTVHAVVSARLRSEYEDVLTRPTLQTKFPVLRMAGVVEAQLERVDEAVKLVPNPPNQISYPRDPNDTPSLNLALYLNAKYIVTRDRDLLDLDASADFRRICPNTRILDPVAFLQHVADSHGADDPQ
jgi:putative PIN family toxin of toxin-antitoxin system